MLQGTFGDPFSRHDQGYTGSTTEAGQGIMSHPLMFEKHMPIFFGTVRRNLQFTIINSVYDSLWSTTTLTDTNGVGTNFHEIPHNFMAFFLPGVIQRLVQQGSAYAVRNAKWRINNIQFINGTEDVTSTTPGGIPQAGNVAPTFDTLYNQGATPPGRLWAGSYDIFGRNRVQTALNAINVSGLCDAAEVDSQSLPLVQFNGNSTQCPVDTPAPNWIRYTKNHKLDADIGCTPKVIHGWRRLIGACNAAGVNDGGVYAPDQAGVYRPNWNAAPATFVTNDIVGLDASSRTFNYREGNSSAMLQQQHVNSNFFIRVRQPPRWGSGATAGSDNTSPQTILGIKCVVMIETEIDVAINMDTLNPFATDPDYYNDGQWLTRTYNSYAPTFENNTSFRPNPGLVPTLSVDKDDLMRKLVSTKPSVTTDAPTYVMQPTTLSDVNE